MAIHDLFVYKDMTRLWEIYPESRCRVNLRDETIATYRRKSYICRRSCIRCCFRIIFCRNRKWIKWVYWSIAPCICSRSVNRHDNIRRTWDLWRNQRRYAHNTSLEYRALLIKYPILFDTELLHLRCIEITLLVARPDYLIILIEFFYQDRIASKTSHYLIWC